MNCLYLILFTFILYYEKSFSHAWTSEELELFDLVEEVNQNFYDVLGLDQYASTADVRKAYRRDTPVILALPTQGIFLEYASTADVRKAYRRLSLQLHPDKNKEEDAEEKFRKMVAVSEVLKDDERRKQYDLILQNGLPDWRQPIYYYRRVRKMGILELFAFLSVLVTLGHFLVSWAAYWEKKYELEEVLSVRFKRKKVKKNKVQDSNSEDLIASQVNMLHKPCLSDLLPIVLVKFFVRVILELPETISSWRERSQIDLQQKEELLCEEEVEERVRKPRKKVKTDLPDFYSIAPTTMNGSVNTEPIDNSAQQISEVESHIRRDWNEQDVVHLVKAMKKFPGGTSQRWEKIASTLKRTVDEVTEKVKTLKSSSVVISAPTALQGLTGNETSLLNNAADQSYDENYNSNCAVQEEQNTKCALEKQKEVDSGWSQTQQKALEAALLKIPKGTLERWDRIAEEVPGKDKEECLLRYKLLVELIRKKKSQPVL